MAFFGDNAVRAWVNFNLSNSSIRDDFNISGLNDNGTGRFDVNIDTDMANENYSVVATGSGAYSTSLTSSNYNRYAEATVRNAGSVGVACYAPNNAVFVDISYCGVIICGDLS
jgi:hypothetical protein|tara:strand:- start:568 stop:906 length:339 start_codon:yes stop_codon:yes gene_type:complete